MTRPGSTAYFVIYMKLASYHGFISKSLNERCFSMRVGSCFSDLHHQETRVPQEVNLYVTYFVYKSSQKQIACLFLTSIRQTLSFWV